MIRRSLPWTIGIVFILAAATLSGPLAGLPGRNSTSTSATPLAPAPLLKPHPFGILLSGRSPEDKIARARAIGARYYRTTSAVCVEEWNGRNEECEAARAAGLELVLTIRNGVSKKPGYPPKNLEKYKRIVGEILDKYRPSLLVIENEENSALFYTGTPEEYHRELAAAAEVARARKIPVTNGGLVSDLVAALVAESWRARGETARADACLRRSVGDKAKNLSKLLKTRKFQDQIARGNTLLAGYKAAGIDYVNFHWYNEDPADLAEAVAYLKNATGLPVVMNEVGQQKNQNPAQVKATLGKIADLGIPFAIWFSIDVSGYAEAQGLFNENGSLRPNGEAYRDFLVSRYGK